jgi:three-Cys-motif partner protein
MEDDGLLTRSSGAWAKDKHYYLQRYCRIFSVGMKNKWRRTYLDMMAGPGICRVRGTEELVPGSPLVALEEDFDDYVFAEENDQCFEALEQRVKAHRKADKCRLVHGSWIEMVGSQGFALPNGLSLAFVDPTGIAQVPWTSVSRLAAAGRVDILFTIQHGMGIKLNMHQYLDAESESAADRFVGTSQWKASLGRAAADPKDLLIQTFTDNMGELGYKTRKWMLMRTDSGTPLYYLCLFSKHERALDFWDKIVVKDPRGQRSFGF